ncbi:MAG: hypothetical protein IT380_16125 [Myxococcales bacterium]|nr:hypothetical protein [Myxococcales bacterium]
MAQHLETLLLFSLPASGKSEMRKYLASLTAKQCKSDFHIGPTLQLDDYPYVHLMHRIDDELVANGWTNVFYKGPQRPFQDGWEWAVLIELLNEDYADLMASRQVRASSAGQLVMDRLDAAHAKVGLPQHLGDVPYRIRVKVAEAIEEEARHDLKARNAQALLPKKGRTVVIECARGGANGSAFPLTPPQGYATTFGQLSEAILEKACVLYIQVEPAESRRKNIERGRPDGAGSILHHSVPMEVMLAEYGTDDMAYLRGLSGKPNTIAVERLFQDADGKYRARTFELPVAFFDNRKDKTTFVREDKKLWQKPDVEAIHQELKRAMDTLAKARG